MKKILLLIHDLQIGGAQKSLVGFCRSLAASAKAGEYEIHLMPVDPSGAFLGQIPENIKLVPPPKELRWLGTHFNKSLLKSHLSFSALLGEIVWLLRSKLKWFPEGYNVQQRLWTSWKSFVPAHRETYDVVISYMDGVPNYYAMDKIRAGKKVLWVHNEYSKLGYVREYDVPYFAGSDALITISEKCKKSLTDCFPQCEAKIHILENISSAADVLEKSNAGSAPEFDGAEGWKLLSVGRLSHQKGFDLAVEAAKRLRDAGHAFRWLIVGEGTERTALEALIAKYDLADVVRLIGARENPYAYMKACDVLVQSSRWEGKSVVLDEAKILAKAIVACNYATVRDSLQHGQTGWIVEMTPEALAEGIEMLCQDIALKETLTNHLQSLPKGNEEELENYIRLMF